MDTARATMPCPVCRTGLVPTERQGIEIDSCPGCRGVWLDRGELDKIIERSAAYAPPPPPQYQPREEYRGERRYDHDDDDDYRRHGRHKKKSFLSELFD